MRENAPSILIVDDDFINLRILGNVLEADYDVRCATSGQEAFSLIEQHPPDLLLLDVVMPDMSGHEIHQRLRDNPRTHEIPVIFVTADTSEDSELRGLREGANDYITKPVSVPILTLRIRNLLERQRLRCEVEQQHRQLEQQHHQLERERSQLREEHDFVNALLNTTSSLILVINHEGAIVRFNSAAEAFTGYTFHEVKDRPFFWERFLLAGQVEIFRQVFISFLKNKTIPRFRNHWVSRNGEQRQFEWSNSVLVDQDSNDRYLMEIGTDITEQRLMENALQESLHEYATLVTMIPLGVYKFRMKKDGRWLFEFVTPQFCDMLGVSAGEIYRDAQCAFQKLHEEDRKEFIALNHAAYQSLTKFEWEGRIQKNESEICWLHIESLPAVLEDGDVLWHGIQYDITERKQYETKLDRIAHYDSLTGVPNRRLLADRLGQALARAQRNQTLLAVCYLDLDAFKPVNDQFGHAAGDQLLVEITRRMQYTLRGGDTLARLGGDEFVLVLADLTRSEECNAVLQRVLATVSSPVAIGDTLVTVSASIGVTLYPWDDGDADTLLRHADHAMYRAKEMGKNRYDFFLSGIECAT
ncbi:two-component system, cell cycle response regulator [Gammaproteobacteria bacterium]